MSTTFAQLQAEVAAILGIDNTDEATNATRYTKAGLRAIGRAGAWEWLHATAAPVTLVAGTYDYALESDLFRIDTRSIRTGGKDSFLKWRKSDWIDGYLGPDWLDAAVGNGTPEYVTRYGNNIRIARKPDSTFAANTLKYQYWRSEPATGTLYLPDEFVDIAVQASLIYGMVAEDDPRSDGMLQKWNNVWLPEMRGVKFNMNDGDQINAPDWMSVGDFGSEPGYP